MAQAMGRSVSTKETDQFVYNFNASISFDQKFYEQDIREAGLIKMLAKQESSQKKRAGSDPGRSGRNSEDVKLGS